MTERTQEVIAAEVQGVIDEIRVLEDRKAKLKHEMNLAKVRDAAAHPWLGKKVRRSVRTYSFSDGRVQRGIVVQNTLPHRLYAAKGHTAEPGETYVKSHSGHTAYRWKPANRETAWELDE